jgi:hypothetical protein
LAKLSAAELIKFQLHTNEWFARHARLELATRAFVKEAPRSGETSARTAQSLRKLFAEQSDPVVKLRALWSLYGLGAADSKFLQSQLAHANEHVRAWAVRLLTDASPLDTLLSQ